MSIEAMIKQQIKDYLIADGCSQSVAEKASRKGLEFFNRGNHKDPYFDSLCHAGLIWAQAEQTGYKFKKPKKVGGKPFVYGKPNTRKHQKDNEALF